MLLLSTLPQKWDHLASVYIQETKVENFSLVSLREQIIGEWECSNAGRASTSAKKLSAVKQKAEDDGRKPRGKRGNKKPRTDKSHGHSHSHLASVASVEPTIVVSPPYSSTPSLYAGKGHSSPPSPQVEC